MTQLPSNPRRLATLITRRFPAAVPNRDWLVQQDREAPDPVDPSLPVGPYIKHWDAAAMGAPLPDAATLEQWASAIDLRPRRRTPPTAFRDALLTKLREGLPQPIEQIARLQLAVASLAALLPLDERKALLQLISAQVPYDEPE